MNQALYDQYLRLKEAGRKKEAKASLDRFIASFRPTEAKKPWVQEFLKGGGHGHRVRHEIYEHLVFPVLLEGYKQQDAWSTFWLAKTAQNLYTFPPLHSRINFKTEWQLLREAWEIGPSEEIKESLLRAALARFDYDQHEWPAGILYGSDGASAAECEEILNEITFVRTLDRDAVNAPFLQEFERRVEEYTQRLQSNAG